MNAYDYDSYCGMYCGACSILVAYRDGNKDDFARFFEEELGMELKCHGCKSDYQFVNCAVCATRKCAAGKGVNRCLDCTSCDLFNEDLYAALVEKLPHMGMMMENLDRIREIGAEAWLAEQAEQWKCPECGTDFSWYADKCYQCSHDVSGQKSYSGTFDTSVFDYLKKK